MIAQATVACAIILDLGEKMRLPLPLRFLALAALLGSLTLAHAAPTKPQVTTPAQFVELNTQSWQKCEGLNGCEFVLLRGDPTTSSSQWMFRLKAGTPFPRHWHSTPENMVGIRGQLVFRFETGDTRTLRAGDFLTYPSGMIHGGVCQPGADCLYYAFNDEPYDIYLEPEQK